MRSTRVLFSEGLSAYYTQLSDWTLLWYGVLWEKRELTGWFRVVSRAVHGHVMTHSYGHVH